MEAGKYKIYILEIGFLDLFLRHETVDVVQSVRTSDCGSEGRGFESHLPPKKGKAAHEVPALFFWKQSKPALHCEQKNKAECGDSRNSLFFFVRLPQAITARRSMAVIPSSTQKRKGSGAKREPFYF